MMLVTVTCLTHGDSRPVEHDRVLTTVFPICCWYATLFTLIDGRMTAIVVRPRCVFIVLTTLLSR